MKSIITILTSLILFNVYAGSTTKVQKQNRKVAQAKITCAPLGRELFSYDFMSENKEGDYEYSYTTEEIALLRNSIFAQYDYKFTNNETQMALINAGCTKKPGTNTEVNLSKIDKANVNMLKNLEIEMLRSEIVSSPEVAQKAWDKTAKDTRKRAQLVQEHYCYFFDENNKYTGILYFGSSRNGKYSLDGILDIEKPYIYGNKEEKKDLARALKQKQLDTTAISSFELTSSGNWEVSNDSKDFGAVKINIGNHKDKIVYFAIGDYKKSNIAECRLNQIK